MVQSCDFVKAAHLLNAITEGLQRDPSGTTVSVKARRPLDSIDGYVVGGSEVKELVTSYFLTPDEELALKGWLAELPEDAGFIGAWLNEDTNNYHFDMVDIYINYDVAMVVAERRGELAIWDGFAQESIDVVDFS